MLGPDGIAYPNVCRLLAIEPGHMIVIRHDRLPYFTLTLVLVKSTDRTELTWERVFDDSQTAQAFKQIVVPSNEQNIDRLNRFLSKMGTA